MNSPGEILCKTIREEAESLAKIANCIPEIFDEDIGKRLSESAETIYLSGVGKNSFIAKKIAATLQSLGIKAHFIDPLNWAHGDIGVLQDRDALVLLSKSGNTEELVSLCQSAQARGTTTFAITCNEYSLLYKMADYGQVLPVEAEAEANDLVPTISTTAFLVFGDALALLIAQERNKCGEFLLNHPGGDIANNAHHENRVRIKMILFDVDGTLTDGKLHYGKDGSSFVSFSAKDGYGISRVLPEYGITPVFLTMREGSFVEARARDLGVDLTFSRVSNKRDVLALVMRQAGLSADEIAYIGDDDTDIGCMRRCGLAACPGDAGRSVRMHCQYVCQSNGGDGAAREFIEWICLGREKD